MKKNMTVMVTGVGGGGHGEQILKALRLSDKNYEIIGGDMSPQSKGLMEVDQSYLLPGANDPEYLNCVLAVCKRHDVKALFHGSEPELKVFSEERKTIHDAGIFLPINPREVIDLCMNKASTDRILRELGFESPKTVQISSLLDLEKVDFLPAVIKPSVGGGGSANILLAQSREELTAFSQYLLNIYKEFIVQEYVGDAESEFTVGVLCSMDGELINSIAVKRMILSALSNRIKAPNRTGRADLGKVLAISSGISQGEIGQFPEVTKQCEKLAVKIGCQGALNIQCRLVKDKVYVFEINPRFSGTTSLRAMVGYNEPDILIRKHLFGESIQPHFQYQSGYIMRGLEEAFINPTNFTDSRKLL